jgi:hypothetical protein
MAPGKKSKHYRRLVGTGILASAIGCTRSTVRAMVARNVLPQPVRHRGRFLFPIELVYVLTGSRPPSSPYPRKGL